MKLFQVKSFLQLASMQSFSAAADALYINQSTLSKHIASLECELGAQLFIRKSRGVELTANGMVFLSFAQTVAEAHRKLLDQLAQDRKNRLVLVTIPAALLEFSGLIDAFCEAHPDIDVELHERDQNGIMRAAFELGADVVLTWNNIVPRETHTIIPILSAELCIGVSANHPLAKYDTLPLSMLRGQPFIMMYQPVARRFLLKLCRDAGFVPDVSHDVSTVNTLIRLVREDKGVAFIYKYHNKDQKDYGDIHLIHLAQAVYHALSLVLPQGKATPAAQVFLAFMQDQFREDRL